MPICVLCRSNSNLKESHLVPKFVGDWLKESSATGFLRGSDQPNRRLQDIQKLRLLCSDCEQRLGKREKLFADKVFYPFQKAGEQSFAYDKWLIYFAVSLAWRVGVRDLEVIRAQAPHLTDSMEKTLDIWRSFLLDERRNAGPPQHHLFFFDYLSKDNANVKDKFHWYTLRSIDVAFYWTEKELFSYCKLPGMVFWCCIKPPRRRGWKNTRIWGRGRMRTPQFIRDDEFGNLMSSRVDLVLEATSKVSEKQARQIHEDGLKNPDRVWNSRSFQTMLAEEYWRKKRSED